MKQPRSSEGVIGSEKPLACHRHRSIPRCALLRSVHQLRLNLEAAPLDPGPAVPLHLCTIEIQVRLHALLLGTEQGRELEHLQAPPRKIIQHNITTPLPFDGSSDGSVLTMQALDYLTRQRAVTELCSRVVPGASAIPRHTPSRWVIKLVTCQDKERKCIGPNVSVPSSTQTTPAEEWCSNIIRPPKSSFSAKSDTLQHRRLSSVCSPGPQHITCSLFSMSGHLTCGVRNQQHPASSEHSDGDW